jgi:hypothetical protein
MEIIGSDPLLAYLKLTQDTVRRRKQRSHPYGFVPVSWWCNVLFRLATFTLNSALNSTLKGLGWVLFVDGNQNQ